MVLYFGPGRQRLADLWRQQLRLLLLVHGLASLYVERPDSRDVDEAERYSAHPAGSAEQTEQILFLITGLSGATVFNNHSLSLTEFLWTSLH